MDNEKDIAQLFSKKFENYEIKPSEEEWRLLSPRLGKVNFFKFSFATFNAYYLMVLITFAAIASYTSYKSIQMSRTIDQLELTIPNSPEKEAVTRGLFDMPPKVIEHSKQPILQPKKEIKLKGAACNMGVSPQCKEEQQIPTPGATVIAPNAEPVIKDTAALPKSEGTTEPTSSTPVRIKKIRKTLVIKPQVVVKKDSVIIKRH